MELEEFKKFGRGKKIDALKSNEVWLYTRVSSKDQKENNSLENQKEAGYEYARKNNFIVTKTFGGTYESASGDITRKEFSRLLDEVRKTEIRPRAIMIFIMSRFSRTGGSGITLADELVERLKVNLIEISSGKTTETEKGKMEIYMGLIRAREENLNRLEVTIPGMKRFLTKGNRLGNAPRGYDHYGPRVKDLTKIRREQVLLINEEGKIIQQAWKMKLQGERDFIILKFLEAAGVKMAKQSISNMWRNTFYCGVSVNTLLDGEVVEGSWEPMISREEFFYVQELLNDNKQGYEVDKVNEARPLQGFIKCSECGAKMTGYFNKAKGVHVYKCQKCKGVSINANTTPRSKGIGAHNQFTNTLSKYQLRSDLIEPFKHQMSLTMEALTKDNRAMETKLKKELEQHETNLRDLKRNQAIGPNKLDDWDFKEFKMEIETKISQIKCQLNDAPAKISNQDFFIENSLNVVQNISSYWASGDIETKHRIQKMMFPDGIVLDTKNRLYLTKKVNGVFAVTRAISESYKVKKENDSENFPESSSVVAGVGLEPTTFGL